MTTEKNKKIDLLDEDAFCYELENLNVRFQRQAELDVKYEDEGIARRVAF